MKKKKQEWTEAPDLDVEGRLSPLGKKSRRVALIV
jgi:hypothetical protein